MENVTIAKMAISNPLILLILPLPNAINANLATLHQMFKSLKISTIYPKNLKNSVLLFLNTMKILFVKTILDGELTQGNSQVE